MTDYGVVFGLTGLTFLFAYISFQLRENENEWNQVTSLIFFNICVVFINVTIYSLLLMVQNDASLSYLETPIMIFIVQIVTWVTIIVMFLFVLLTLLNALKMIKETVEKNGWKFG